MWVESFVYWNLEFDDLCYEGFWVIIKYEDIVVILKNFKVFLFDVEWGGYCIFDEEDCWIIGEDDDGFLDVKLMISMDLFEYL